MNALLSEPHQYLQADIGAVCADFVSIRGRRLVISELVDPRLRDKGYVEALRERMKTAQPFPHLVTDDWFHPGLLELVREEFDLFGDKNWKQVAGKYETIHRSVDRPELGPASQLYFSIIYSGWFVDMLSRVSGIEDLVVDPFLYGGGLHETRQKGVFGIHRDFDVHVRTGLDNEMVFITYLNRDWNPAWGGALELWDAAAKSCVGSVVPEMGRSILMRHTAHSYHGYPAPLTNPPDHPRRSIAAYYYTNRWAAHRRARRISSAFLFGNRYDGIKDRMRRMVPQLIRTRLKSVLGR